MGQRLRVERSYRRGADAEPRARLGVQVVIIESRVRRGTGAANVSLSRSVRDSASAAFCQILSIMPTLLQITALFLALWGRGLAQAAKSGFWNPSCCGNRGGGCSICQALRYA